jgi:glycosyltransferase involved in cell wall biosynthesis
LSSQPRHRLSIVLPAFNEEASITTAVHRSLEVGDRLFEAIEVLVVDDGSKDRTAELVLAMQREDPRVKLLQHPRNRGYGEALRTGFTSASMDLVFFTDADNQFDLDEIELFLPLIDRVDVVAGYRAHRVDPPFRLANAKVWNLLVRILFYVPIRDIDCAFKMFRREVFEGVHLESVGAMVNTELMVKIARSGYSVVEVPVSHLPRTAGAPHGAKLSVIFRALRELATMRGRLAKMDAAR